MPADNKELARAYLHAVVNLYIDSALASDVFTESTNVAALARFAHYTRCLLTAFNRAEPPIVLELKQAIAELP